MPGFFKRKKKSALPYCAAVVAAAGSSTRMGEDKLMLPLGEWPVIVHTLRALEYCPHIQEIVVVTREDLIVPIGNLCADYAFTKVTKVVVGGDNRTQSVRLGLLEVSDKAELIAIQDGARPLVSEQVLEEVIQTAAKCGAAAPAIPVKDTGIFLAFQGKAVSKILLNCKSLGNYISLLIWHLMQHFSWKQATSHFFFVSLQTETKEDRN